ncbi:MAG: hypothetical protein B7Y25_02005 [Alphaproteobacteria bacterium 16-39-46]|nr:MAG: hypothetical protein B7Y25_02005 [Alphaproteobacteria bacterium 16-39-46]OZA43752.1 MAG: hypothetical protein B7X84_02255 [Alphaproteobacteria bacterium 17-39-52]HQS83568.1 hypothetical protein [Alphaproteobacteria bacterium]HQS93333.1 hypothetical protein [Alphaproteobacteria bacterium]
MKPKILIWDNDGTVTGSKNPNDPSKVILSGVEKAMREAEFNFMISGFKSPESEAQDFDPEKVASNLKDLMTKLPIKVAAFSPLIGGISCYVLILKPGEGFFLKKAHEDPRYHDYIGHFKKPDIGMFVVIRDIALEEFGLILDEKNSLMIGDSWQDEAAAKSFGIPFKEARLIHQKLSKVKLTY